LFTPAETTVATETLSYADGIRLALRDAMRDDERVFLLGEDIGAPGGVFNVTAGLQEEFGADRVRDTPIAEAGITAAAVGAAIGGMRPVVEIMFNDFLTLALDQIANEAAKLHYMTGGQITVPMTVRAPYGPSRSGAGHHSQTLYAWLCHVPGVKVVAPSNPFDAYSLLRASIEDQGPVVFFEDKMLYQTSSAGTLAREGDRLGVARVARPGNDVTVVAIGRYVPLALELAEELASEVDVEVIDPRTLFPLDEETILASAMKTRRVAIIESGVRKFGVASEIATRVYDGAFDYLDAPVVRIAARDVVIPFSPSLESAALPTKDDLRRAVLALGGG
jgi:pyruvate/2-oxoglutarate/acetoin dehydrogenase E1 component